MTLHVIARRCAPPPGVRYVTATHGWALARVMPVADRSGHVSVQTWEQEVGANVRRIRQARGMSQDQLAAGMTARGVPMSQPTAAKIESATRPLRVNELPALAAVLGVDVGDLLPESSGLHDPVRV